MSLEEDPIRDQEALRLYNGSQLFLIQYMLRRGLVSSIEEYGKFIAPLFEMLAERHIELDSREWEEIIEDSKAQINLITNNNGNTKINRDVPEEQTY